MFNKKLIFSLFLIFTIFGNFNCNKCDELNSLADLIINGFRVSDNPVVNVAANAALTIKNLIYNGACRKQETAESFYSNYQVFFREDNNASWSLVGTSDDFKIESLCSGDTEDIENNVIFTQTGQYYLKGATDIGFDVNEYDENNNGRNNDNGEFDLRVAYPSADIINYVEISIAADTDLELMKKRKEEGIYVIFD